MKFEDFKFVEEYPTIIAGRNPLRLYRSRFVPGDLKKPIEKYRWHFGFPKKLLPPPMLLMLETSLYWGEQHWKEDEDFYVYWLTDISEISEGVPKKLNKRLESYLKSYNKVLNWIKESSNFAKEVNSK